ncbi:flavin-binding monooxygenase [Aspergillus violaceofuscus CBS 115571]|uniref:Flavin-binding monooxygenase n=1 Tax=Aspergillus violaceofuscus (strain CBS 115571) TaxID=1450538 RepID=A0A2V5GR59_ASPV1|nr:flavin-binding monooxygenase [Aspergillus violaceofuscus CBS 115571]
MGSTDPPNPVFQKYGVPDSVPRLGSNSTGPHPSSSTRPVHHPEWDIPSDRGYVVSNHLINEPPPDHKTFKVIVLGAGAAGIDFLHHAPAALEALGVEVVCYDKNADVGGTWYENRYPGCACDIPSVAYTFPWKSNPGWTSYYSGAKEIWEYMKQIVEEEGMMQYIRLKTAVTSAVWDESRSKWTIQLRRTDNDGHAEEWEEECDMFINGCGFLNAWKWPDIPGLHSFQGKLFHTAAYPEGLSLKDQKVAVIGSGSSGVQVVASIQDEVSELYTWVRSPVWITAAFGQSFAGKDGRNFDYSSEQKEVFRLDPDKYHRYKKAIENELNQRIKLALRDTAESDTANAYAYSEMYTKLQSKPHVRDAIIPTDFNVACRRPTPGNGFLEAIASEKTIVFTSPIKEITPRGFIDTATGIEHEVDVIICATGFNTSYQPRFPLIGLDGVSLADKWSDTPTSYLAIAVDGFPNYFTYSGPFAPVGHGSILPILSHITHYFIQTIQRMRKQHIRRLSPKPAAVEDFVEHAQAFLPRTCWADPCSSWFKQGRKDGPVIVWPGSRLAYFELLRTPTLSDYDVAYWSGNRFGYLGSGFVDVEFPSGEHDLTWYLDWYSGNENWQKKGMEVEKEEVDTFKQLSEGALAIEG